MKQSFCSREDLRSHRKALKLSKMIEVITNKALTARASLSRDAAEVTQMIGANSQCSTSTR
jgi:hypothetical protein